MELCRHVVTYLVANSPQDVKDELQEKEWKSRYIVATLADEKPEYHWDDARVLLVFKI